MQRRVKHEIKGTPKGFAFGRIKAWRSSELGAK